MPREAMGGLMDLEGRQGLFVVLNIRRLVRFTASRPFI